jgi:hypothetical protein
MFEICLGELDLKLPFLLENARAQHVDFFAQRALGAVGRSARFRQCAVKVPARCDFLRKPGLECGFAVHRRCTLARRALARVSDRCCGICQAKFERLERRLRLGELCEEVGFASCESLDVSGYRLVVAAKLFEGGLSLIQPCGELVTIGRRLRQLSFELRLALHQLPGGCGKRLFVTLQYIAPRHVGLSE